LLDNTARQIALQRLLGHTTPQYLHLPLATHKDGRKLSKQTGAAGLDSTLWSAKLNEVSPYRQTMPAK